jgi:hypothetical protein
MADQVVETLGVGALLHHESEIDSETLKHVRDIRVFISMQNSTLYDDIKGVSNGLCWRYVNRRSHI